ncbi:hypothetical protein [Mycolicibacterium brumae]|uniref:hypothetical protein n=1 Tax=Mycolicibacterium brumae TaxID=85968 RepID=UPI000FFA06FC|nr:hypothetical protein [Mycolicibacterium brumae]MCV7194126.1 hypothetical protein [Mycolicibacterium brumae]RWA22702.1 hypothetical protein MBRU_12190 [Mycolicibacterium brumae DSM 44177]UWW07493.1 hypothetical protein L2Z93_000508 [Mycolicibacterium brumae]
MSDQPAAAKKFCIEPHNERTDTATSMPPKNDDDPPRLGARLRMPMQGDAEGR